MQNGTYFNKFLGPGDPEPRIIAFLAQIRKAFAL